MGIGDWISDTFGSKNKEKAKAPTVDANAYQYGGSHQGATDAASRYRGWAEGAYQRGAPQADYGVASDYGTLSNYSRGAQSDMAQLMARRARGDTPSIAEMQAQRDMQRAQAAQMAGASSARGAAGIALAQQNAANNIANAQGQISSQAQVNAANERAAAEQAAFGAFGNMRQGDQNSQQLAAQMAQYNAGLQSAQRAQNDQFALGMTNNEMGVQNSQLTARMNMQSQQAANALGASNINASVGGQNAAMNQQNAMNVVGLGQNLAGTAMMPGKADGGPVKSGKPELVGERGPEIIVPKRDGIVIPNHADQPPVVWGADGRAYVNTPSGLAPMTEKPRFPTFERDPRPTQDQIAASKMSAADAIMAGYKKSLGQGASVARDEGEVDQAAPGWLSDYMNQQQDGGGSLAVAMRAAGGPLQAGQPAVVGESGGTETFVPSTWGVGGPDVEGQRLALQQAQTAAGQTNAAAQQAQAYESPWQADVRRYETLRKSNPELLNDEDRATYRRSKGVLSRAMNQPSKDEPPARAADDDKAAVVEGKALPKRPSFGSALGDMGKQMQAGASRVDTGYHGGGSYVSPQLLAIPARAEGGPVYAGVPTLVGEGGLESMVPTRGPLLQVSGPSAYSDASGAVDIGGSGGITGGMLRAASTGHTGNRMSPVGGGGIVGGGMPMREDGGPVKAGQPTVVGDGQGAEKVVSTPREDANRAAAQDYAARELAKAQEEKKLALIDTLRGYGTALINPVAGLGQSATGMVHQLFADDSQEAAHRAARQPRQVASDKQDAVIVGAPETPGAVLNKPWQTPQGAVTPAAPSIGDLIAAYMRGQR